jgi:hypothetical protein
MSDKHDTADENSEVFHKELPNLSRGKYVLMRGGKIINVYDTLEDAHSTGLVFYADKKFSIGLRAGAGKAASKKSAGAVKKVRAKKGAAKKKTPSGLLAFVAAAETTPRRESIPGISPELPDLTNWRLAAAAPTMRIRPFYTGPDSRPFSCMRATQIRIDPPKKSGGTAFSVVNDFYVVQECR